MIYILVPMAAFVGWAVGLRQGFNAGFSSAERLVRIKLGWLKGGDA